MSRTIPASTVTNTTLVPAPKTGQISSARWRGPRGSAPLLAALEQTLSDVLHTFRRALTANPLPSNSYLLAQPATSGLYGTQDVAPSEDTSVAFLNTLAPSLFQMNMIRIQSLRVQCNYRLTA